MLWSKSLAVIAVATLLAGCGFRPLYGTIGEDLPVTTQLAQIHIAAIPDRTGQKLRNFLLDRINPGGQPRLPLYYLKVKINVTRTDLGIERDETATRALLVLTANYQLFNRTKTIVLVKGSTQSTNSFNIVVSDFATLSAETDATDRASREISDDIKTRLALYFQR